MAIIAAILLTVAAGGCGSGSNSGTDSDSAERPSLSFMLDWTPNTNHIGLYVAQQLGYFDSAGIDVTILPTAQAGAETSVENGVATLKVPTSNSYST